MARSGRSRLDIGARDAESFDGQAKAYVRISTEGAIDYTGGIQRVDVIASDTDPNVTPPSDALVIVGNATEGIDDKPCSAIALSPDWSGAKQAVKLAVWVETRLESPLRQWILKEIVNFSGADDEEAVVAVNYRRSFVQIVSGADAGHPFSLYIGKA